MTGKQILIVDDEAKMRRVLEIVLQKNGHRVFGAADGKDALAIFNENTIDLVIADLRMPEMGGLELLVALRDQRSDVPVIVVTAHGTIETAVAAMKHGAFDYVLRPFDMDVLLLSIDRALDSAIVARQNAFLREEIERGWHAFVGTSRPMQDLYSLIQRAGPSKASVLVTGETGTGKELAARALHHASPRRDQLFVPINCAAIPAEMLEGELFGHEKGAFTGAIRARIGKFELADNGTLFLDEITEMPLALQAKMLRVLQEGTIERLGSNRTIQLDLRVVAATNHDARDAIRAGKLREDLYYRINVISLHLAPLRERIEDIPMLVHHFVEKFSKQRTILLAPSMLERLQSYAWPGNVRELENLVERAVILSGSSPIDLEPYLPRDPDVRDVAKREGEAGAPIHAVSLENEVEKLESRLIASALERADGNKARAAALLQISERTLWYKLKKFQDRNPSEST